jgi:hypothetical protein
MNESRTPAEPLVALSILALELLESADELAERLGADSIVVADELGRRAVPASVARGLILAEARRQYDEAESIRRMQAEAERRGREFEARNPVAPGFLVGDLPAGTTPVQALTAAARQERPYSGGTYIPAPSRLDWVFGVGESAGTIGPQTAEEHAALAAQQQPKDGAQ